MKKTAKFMLSMVATAVAMSSVNVMAEEQEDGINIGGAVRVNYAYRDYDESNKDKLGELDFDMAAIKFDGKKGIGLSR